jgi:hypothetical protein
MGLETLREPFLPLGWATSWVPIFSGATVFLLVLLVVIVIVVLVLNQWKMM